MPSKKQLHLEDIACHFDKPIIEVAGERARVWLRATPPPEGAASSRRPILSLKYSLARLLARAARLTLADAGVRK